MSGAGAGIWGLRWGFAFAFAFAAAAAAALPVLAAESPAAGKACGRSDFEAVVEEAATALRDLNAQNKPAFQEKLRALKQKRGWSHDEFLKEAAPFVRDDKTAEYDAATDQLLAAISTMGQEGAAAKAPDCAALLELRGRMTVLVHTQQSKWAHMFGKIDMEMSK